MGATFTLTVNGQKQQVVSDPQRSLLEVLREDLQLLGTKYGCGEARCGACSVIVDGKRVFSCRTAIEDVDGKTVRTIEGLADGDKLHPVQQAFLEENAFQCAYCTSGMIMCALALLEEKPNPTDAEIITGMNRNLCRCCSYPKITNAVRRAAKTATFAGRA
ncbi:MAG TPA: (2Fe-2S)-binding protein [Pirellulales bacterium]|jgi:aerobic-type carbon monoxide dehydrogenase small subunit (CoxS/CutS family)|nr:(2Fe-2S)-binding protein [Pirellulales bacterium]